MGVCWSFGNERLEAGCLLYHLSHDSRSRSGLLDRFLHRSLRVSCKPFLQCASVRIRETRERARPGKSVNVVPDRLVVGMKLDSEAFFAYRRMIGQRAVRKTEPLDRTGFFDRIYNPAGIQRPKTQVVHRHGNRRSCLNRYVRPIQFEPRYIEHFPLLDRVPSALEGRSPDAQPRSIVIHDIASGRRNSRRADLLVRKFSMRLRREERVYRRRTWLG